MRLTQLEINKIKELTNNVYGKSDVWLFGSRVYDDKRGGDIDLFIEMQQKSNLATKLALMTKLQRSLGYRKIDLVVKGTDSKDRVIFEIAKEQGVLL